MTMDYKKKYENALEWARQVINGECGFIRKDVEEVFPELKKSEDEKIRKDVLAFIRRKGQHIDKYKWHKWIAWLEKQGERPTPIDIDKMVYKYGNTKEDCTNGLPVNCQIRAYRQGINDTLNLVFNLEKQGEQNHTDKVKPKFKVKYANCEYNVLEIKEIAGITYFGIEDEPNHIDYVLPDNCEIVSGYGYGVKEKGSPYPTKSAIFSEQNLAWSEEDEELLNSIIKEIESELKKPYFEGYDLICNKKISWLKSLKERMNYEQRRRNNSV